MRTYFDISTSARWSGHAVGIVRVERELARRAAALSPDTAYCVYDKVENRFKALRPEVVEPILAGELSVAFDLPAEALPAAQGSFRYRAREAVLRWPVLYRAFQRLRGHAFTLEQIAEIRRQEAQERAAASGAGLTPLADVVLEVIDLDSNTRIVSGGLDWEFKNLRAIYDLKKTHGFSYAAIVYDLIPEILPQYVVPSYVHLLRDYFGELFWVSDACLCISESTRADMLQFCRQNGIPAPRSATFPLGCDVVPAVLDDAPRQAASLPSVLEGKRYALFVSTIEPRKNHRALYQAWRRCLEQGRIDATTCRLVFVGRTGWAMGDFLQEMEADPLVQDSIVRLSDVSDHQLNALYANAEFGLFPSFYEGYGLPLAEMLAHRKACLSSSAGSLREVGGDLVEYVDPLDTIGWAEAIARMFNDHEVRDHQQRRIDQNYQPTRWDDAAALFFRRLESL